MNKELTKSPEVLQKEAEIEALAKALKRKKTTLKSLKTRLKNTREKIEDIQRNTQVNIMNKMEDMDSLRIEIADLAAELKKSKNMSAEDKQQLGEMAEGMAKESMGEEFEEYKAFKERMASGDFDFEEEFGERIRDIFEPFKVQPTEVEKKNIRKVFLKLSKKFHPDKAQNDEQSLEYHSVMQKINEAYQNNDIETLLEMERLYLLEEPDFEGVAMADVLQQKIDYLNREIAFIGNQAERVSEEIKNLRESDMGQMLTAVNRAAREGEGLDEMSAHLDMGINIFTKLRDVLKDSIKRDEISPMINELLVEMNGIGMEDDPVMSLQEMMRELDPDEINEMISEMLNSEEAGGMFDVFGSDENMTNSNPKFPEGSSVRVFKTVKSPIMSKVNMKDWEGRVNKAMIDRKNKKVYRVVFDSVTLNGMPDEFIKHSVDYEEDFQEHIFYEHQLKASQVRDSQEESIVAYRSSYHAYAWKFLEDKQATAIKSIMMSNPAMRDEDNWHDYLSKNLRFPIDVVTMGHLENPPGLKAKILTLADIDPSFGIMVKLKIPKMGTAVYPLMDLKYVKNKGKQHDIFELYHEWAEEVIDVY